MIEILEHLGSNPEHRAEIELEWISHEVLNSFVLDKNKEIKKIGRQLAQVKKAHENEKRAREELGRELENVKKSREALEKEIAELRRRVAP